MELIDALCSEEEDTPFTIDYLYWLEGLTYPVLSKLMRAKERGEAMPVSPTPEELDDMPATIRRRLAEAMGVPREKSGEFAGANVEKAKTIDSVARSLQRAGVQVPAGRAELLQVATTIYASMVSSAAGEPDELEFAVPDPSWAVEVAEGLITAVNKRSLQRYEPELPEEVFCEGA
jgi:hypothetical protein